MKDLRADIVVAHVPGARDIVDETVAFFRSAGVSVDVEEAEQGPYAGLAWLLPTAISVLLAEKYFGTMLEEAAKDHYVAVKAAFARLLAATTGPERKLAFVTVGTRGKIDSSIPAVLSMYATLRSGQRIKFLFEHELPVAAHDSAIQALHEVMALHYKAFPGDPLSVAISAAGLESAPLVVMRFELAKGWEPWKQRV